jgi:hypothetical protein
MALINIISALSHECSGKGGGIKGRSILKTSKRNKAFLQYIFFDNSPLPQIYLIDLKIYAFRYTFVANKFGIIGGKANGQANDNPPGGAP